MNATTLKIISGGQTGADRAALDAALAAGVPCGGWCPKGRRAEDGPIPPQYPMTEMSGTGYPPRTRRNVADSDATVIVSFGPPDRGTALTLRCCHAARKPTIVINASATPVETAAVQLAAFVEWNKVKTLNVAGPRASKQPQIYDYVLKLVGELLRPAEGRLRKSVAGNEQAARTARAGLRPGEAGRVARGETQSHRKATRSPTGEK